MRCALAIPMTPFILGGKSGSSAVIIVVFPYRLTGPTDKDGRQRRPRIYKKSLHTSPRVILEERISAIN